MVGSLFVAIGPCSIGVDQFHHGKNVQIHSKYSETQSELGRILV
jgi:hypothetical protein